jgi:hypothetical protein
VGSVRAFGPSGSFQEIRKARPKLLFQRRRKTVVTISRRDAIRVPSSHAPQEALRWVSGLFFVSPMSSNVISSTDRFLNRESASCLRPRLARPLLGQSNTRRRTVRSIETIH